jgi:Family of unknown function (DUF6279)
MTFCKRLRDKALKQYRIVGLLLLVTALTACSAVGLLYSQLDSALYLWVDKYVDLSNAQSIVFKNRSAELLKWHRKTELPRYAAYLERAAALMPGEPPPSEYCSKFEEFQALSRTTIDKAIPDIAALVIASDDEQLSYLKKELEKNNKKWVKENLPATREKQLKLLLEQTVDRYDDFFGSVSDEQEAFIAKQLETSPWDPQRWLAERKRRQQVMLALIAELRGADIDTAEKKITRFADQFYVHPDATEEKWIASLRSYACNFNAAVHKQMSTKQRAYAQKKLLGYASDFRALAAGR